MSDHIWGTDWLGRKTKFFFIALLPFTLSEDFAVKSALSSLSRTHFFFLFPVASSFSASM